MKNKHKSGLFRKQQNSLSDSISLPNDIFCEILSWLPPKDVIKFKCVCKAWHNLITHRSFTLYHFNHARHYYYLSTSEPETIVSHGKIAEDIFNIIKVFRGLAIEKGHLSSRYRLRNMITEEILHLPNPEPNRLSMLGTIDKTGINLVSVYKNWIDFDNNRLQHEFEYLNIDRDLQWKRMSFPELGHCHYLLTSKVFCCARRRKQNIDVFSFDLNTECCFSCKAPEGLFLSPSKFLTLTWNKMFAIGEIVGKKLVVVVLEDYRNGVRRL